MSISERFRELWQKVRFLGGWQVRMILLTAVLLGGFLSFYQFCASANDDKVEQNSTSYVNVRIAVDTCYGCQIEEGDLENSFNFFTHVKITRADTIDENGEPDAGTVIYNNGPIDGYNVMQWGKYDDSGRFYFTSWTDDSAEKYKTYYYFIEFIDSYENKYFVGTADNGKSVKVYTDNDITTKVNLIKSDYPTFTYEDQYENALNTSGYVQNSGDANKFCCYDTGAEKPCVVDIASESDELCMKVKFKHSTYVDELPKPARIDGKYYSERNSNDGTEQDGYDYFTIPLKKPEEKNNAYVMTCLTDNNGEWGNYYYIDKDDELSEPAKSLFTNEKFFSAGGGESENCNASGVNYAVCKKQNSMCTHDWVVFSKGGGYFDLSFASLTDAIKITTNSIDNTTMESVEEKDWGKGTTGISFTPSSALKDPVIKINSVEYPSFTNTFKCDDATLPADSITATVSYTNADKEDKEDKEITLTSNNATPATYTHTWTFQDLYKQGLNENTTNPYDAVTNVTYNFKPATGYVIDAATYDITGNANSFTSSDWSFKKQSIYPPELNQNQKEMNFYVNNVYVGKNNEFENLDLTIVGVRRQITPTFTSESNDVKSSINVEIKNGNTTITGEVGTKFTQQILGVGEKTLDVTLKIKNGDWRRFKTNPPTDCVKCSSYSITGIAGSTDGKTVTFKLHHKNIENDTITINSNIFQNTVFVDSNDGTTFTNDVFSTNYTLTATKTSESETKICPVATKSTFNNLDHAWVIYLDEDTNASITIIGDDKLHYGFAPLTIVIYNNTRVNVDLNTTNELLGDRKNKLTFQITGLTDSSDGNTVSVSGLSYLKYTNEFKYTLSEQKLSDYLTISYGINPDNTDGNALATTDGSYYQKWTYASTDYFNNYNISLNPGYAIDDTFEIKDGSTPLETTSKNDKSCSFTLDCIKHNTPLSDHSVTLGPVKSRYGIKFKPTGDDISAIQDYVQISYDDSKTIGWNADNYAPIDTTLGETITVRLNLTDKRRQFVDNLTNKIKINDSDSTKYGISAEKTSSKDVEEITITLSHAATDGCTIEIADSILEWKTTIVQINVPAKTIDSEHLKDCVISVEPHPEDKTSSELSVTEKSENNTSSALSVTEKDGYLIYQTELPDQSLNNLTFKVTCKTPDRIAFNDNASVTALWGGTVIDEISVTKHKHDNATWNKAIEFTLDISKLPNLYAETLEFDIEGLESVYRDVNFNLCQNTVLYDSRGNQLFKNSGLTNSKYTAKVPYGQSGIQYVIVYSDYSKIFDLSNVTIAHGGTTLFDGNANVNGTDNSEVSGTDDSEVGGSDLIKLQSFNKVEITLPTITATVDISCITPGETSPMISFSSAEGLQYALKDEDSSDDPEWFSSKRYSVNYNKTDFKFYVKALDGYDINSLKISSNGTEITDATYDKHPNAMLFTVKDPITSNTTITGSVSAKQCTVTFDTTVNLKARGTEEPKTVKYYCNGLELKPDAGKCTVTALYGSMLSFDVELPEGYTQSPDMTVYCKSQSSEQLEQLTKINGHYLINNITDDTEVTIKNLSLNDYPITFTSSDKVVFHGCEGNEPTSGSPKTTIEHGGDYQFSVKNKEGYNLNDMVVVAKYSNGEIIDVVELSGGKHCYQISNITQPCTISAENISDMEYTVQLEPVDGIIYQNDVGNVITDKVAVKHGHNFEFYVVLDDAYDDSKENIYVQVTKGGSYIDPPRKLATGRYIVQNITHDISLKIGNVAKNSYIVSLMDEEGIDYYDSNGKVITGNNDVEHNADLKFKVNLYPAYAGSDITVMLGDKPMQADSSGFYTISNVTENKTVTVTGIEESVASELVNSINSLLDSIGDLGDVDDVIELTKIYESLSDEEKALITNIDKLTKLQEEAKKYNHISNGVTIDGVDWYIKLYANPITDDTDACGRIYKNLTSEYILSLYDVYLWNTLTDTRYTLPEGQSVVIHLPTPDMQYFDNPTAVHEKSSSKLEFLTLSVNGDTTSFTTSSFSAMGIVATRNSTPGRSSLLDAADANLDAISNFAAAAFGNSSTTVTNTNSSDLDSSSSSNTNVLGSVTDGNTTSDNISGNINEKFRGRQNKITPAGSALRLILVLMILILLSVILYLYFKRKKNKGKSSNS